MCGIFGAFDVDHASKEIYLALHAQQHRAKESAGMVVSDNGKFYRYAGPGIVQNVFSYSALNNLPGRIGVGHIRYSTVEDNPQLDNTQPIVADYHNDKVAIAHNGNLTNVGKLYHNLNSPNLLTSMDTELILRLFCLTEGNSLMECVKKSLTKVQGTYTLLFLLPDCLIAVRDPSGNRPLSLGKRGKSWFVSSETCAFDMLEIDFVRDIEPGEILIISQKGLESDKLCLPSVPLARCIFEQIYYGLPASLIFEEYASEFRKRLGCKLEEVCPVIGGQAVMSIPDSANFIAEGYASSGRSGKLSSGILRSHYIGRTFLEPTQAQRELKVKRKFQLVKPEIVGKSIVLVDDSIVRLNTMPSIVRMIRGAKAKEVHVRIACPPITHPCYYGIDMPTTTELAAATMTIEEMRTKIDADSLEFLPLEELQKLSPDIGYCYACMNGEYPIPIG